VSGGDASRLAELAPGIMNTFHSLRQGGHARGRLSMRQYQVLLLVSASGESNSSALCRKMGIACSTGTELIGRMIESGYLERARHPEDQRQVAITVSQKGREELDLRKQGLIKIFENLLESLPADRRSDFLSSFESIAEILKELSDEA